MLRTKMKILMNGVEQMYNISGKINVGRLGKDRVSVGERSKQTSGKT